MPLLSFQADLEREENGDWVDVQDVPGIRRLKVRSQQTDDFKKAYSRMMRRMRKLKEKDRDPFLEASLRRLLFEHVLLDWDLFEVVEGDGRLEERPIPYTRELAEKWMMDPSFRPLHGAVEEASNELSRLDQEVREADMGNSSEPSDTSSRSDGSAKRSAKQSTTTGSPEASTAS